MTSPIDTDRLERLAREVRWPEDWPQITSATGDSLRRTEPHSRIKLNTHASWAVGPPRKTLLDAAADATYIAAASPDVILRLIAVVRAAELSAKLAPRVPDGNKFGYDWTVSNPVIAPLRALTPKTTEPPQEERE